MVSHTPKRGVGGSNPLWDASKQRRKPLFSRVFGFSYMKRHEAANRNLATPCLLLLGEGGPAGPDVEGTPYVLDRAKLDDSG